jgi:hypothetical protein
MPRAPQEQPALAGTGDLCQTELFEKYREKKKSGLARQASSSHAPRTRSSLPNFAG